MTRTKSMLAATLLAAAFSAMAQPAPLQSLPALDVASYMGSWYQVLWIPNRFQKQCVADTAATYRDLGNGAVEVINRCRLSDGSTDSVTGLARPPSGVARIEAGQLQPARLEVSFARLAALDGRRLGRLLGGGSGPDGRYAIVSEASREYLWVLSRQPALTLQDEALIRSRLTTLGFDLARVQPHRHNPR